MMIQKSELHLVDIHKEYVSAGTKIGVLNNVSARFIQGMSHAITGASGSGKSTILNLLAGIDTPTAGSVLFNRRDLAQLNPAEKSHFLSFSVGLVFQNPHLINDLTIQENVMLPGFIAGLSRAECHERSGELLDQVGIYQKALDKPCNLSGGQQQRAALARALFNKPTFLLADEPTGNLDAQTSISIIDLLLSSAQKWHMGLIISTHDQSLANRLDQKFHVENALLKNH